MLTKPRMWIFKYAFYSFLCIGSFLAYIENRIEKKIVWCLSVSFFFLLHFTYTLLYDLVNIVLPSQDLQVILPFATTWMDREGEIIQ